VGHDDGRVVNLSIIKPHKTYEMANYSFKDRDLHFSPYFLLLDRDIRFTKETQGAGSYVCLCIIYLSAGIFLGANLIARSKDINDEILLVGFW
jgi:hypothetical protein